MTYLGIVEIGDSVFYLQRDEQFMYAGTVCNAGFIELYKEEIDNVLSIDENLAYFIEVITEREIKKGVSND